MIYLTSDLHLYHDKDFIWGARGFNNVFEHDRTLIANINETVGEDDTLYILGDICMGSLNCSDTRMYLGNLLRSIRCKNVYFIEGNHDSAKKSYFYQTCNFVNLGAATWLHAGKQKILLSHYPMMTKNINYKGSLSREVVNLFGHTHQTEQFYSVEGIVYPLMFHVGIESNNFRPVSLEYALDAVNKKYYAICSQ